MKKKKRKALYKVWIKWSLFQLKSSSVSECSWAFSVEHFAFFYKQCFAYFPLKIAMVKPLCYYLKVFHTYCWMTCARLCLTMLDFLSFSACSRILLIILWLFPLSMFHFNIDFISGFFSRSLYIEISLSIYLMNWLIGFYMVKLLTVMRFIWFWLLKITRSE